MVRQVRDQIWVAGFSTEHGGAHGEFWIGLAVSLVARGSVDGSLISAEWAAVPRGTATGHGSLSLVIDQSRSPNCSSSEGATLVTTSETGGFPATSMNYVSRVFTVRPAACVFSNDYAADTQCRNEHAFRNDDETMDHQMKTYRDYVVLTGRIVRRPNPETDRPMGPTPIWVNHPGANGAVNIAGRPIGRTYGDFICARNGDNPAYQWWTGGDPPDGDMNFSMEVETANEAGTGTDQIAGFWDTGWRHDPSQISAKWEHSVDSKGHPYIDGEMVMYGREADSDRCAGSGVASLPGWADTGANSGLVDGRAINGLDGTRFVITEANAPECRVVLGGVFSVGAQCAVGTIAGWQPSYGDRVRITGALALDCHATNCHESDPIEGNVEVHDVFGIDVIRPSGSQDVSGTWAANDGGTYYATEVGADSAHPMVWLLGMSLDRGLTYTTVAQAELDPGAGTLSGTWVDVPLGARADAGDFSLVLNQRRTATHPSSTLLVQSSNGILDARVWEKLRDSWP